jgi:methylase of polypeptide subunit release factors
LLTSQQFLVVDCSYVLTVRIHCLLGVPDRQFDLIISNPPYIEQGDPCLKDLIHEPQTALVSGKDGLDDICCGFGFVIVAKPSGMCTCH